MSENPVVSKTNMHSLIHYDKFRGDSVIVKERIQYQDGAVLPNVKVIENLKRSFYVTKQRYRNHEYKIEHEKMSRLDRHVCLNHEMPRKIAEALGMYAGAKYFNRPALFKSPFLYGADISIEALIKMRYLDNYPNAAVIPAVGFLDIETSTETKEIIAISFYHGDTVHITALKAYCYDEVGGKRTPFTPEDVQRHAAENIAKVLPDRKFNFDVEFLDTSIQLVAWIFKKIHAAQMDFIGIWNMNFDIPKIVTAIEAAKMHPKDFFSDPSVPKHLWSFKYHEDQRPVAHFTLKWHWVYTPCSSQFVDQMGLYSQCRRTAGFRASYTLENVLQDHLGLGKLPLKGGSHTVMQRHHFKDYLVYNAFDVIGLHLLEKKVGDFTAMSVLSGPTPVEKFATQTIRATNSLYWNLLSKGLVLATNSRDDAFRRFDHLFQNAGGSVLPPSSVHDVGVHLQLS